MSTILLAGDSWGIGVFEGSGNNYGPIGKGPASILQELGHTVINISKAGGSNWLMIDRLNNSWDNFARCLYGVDPYEYVEVNWDNIDYVVYLQTDIFREKFLYEEASGWQKVLDKEFADNLINYDTVQQMIDEYFYKFYSELNAIGVKHNKKILCLGCWSKLHPSISDYSNLVSVVPSAIKLLLPELIEDVYMSDPEWYSQLAKDSKFMAKFGNEFKPMIMHATQKLQLLYDNFHEVHPDIAGYSKLVDQILLQFDMF